MSEVTEDIAMMCILAQDQPLKPEEDTIVVSLASKHSKMIHSEKVIIWSNYVNE